MFILKCFNGTVHNGDYLIEIFVTGYDEAVSIKWCTECGAVVGDIESDGRRIMGKEFKMKWPKVANLRTVK